MNMRSHASLVAGALVGLFVYPSLATGAPIDLTVDPAQSSINMTITVDISLASDTDADSSTLSGNIEIELDDAGNPSQITLNDLVVFIDQTLSYNWSFGFFGSADATMTDASLMYATPGLPAGPVPIVDSMFSMPDVLIGLGGLMDTNYDIFLAGTGSQVINLSEQEPTLTVFNGDVFIVDDTITITSTIPLDTTQPILDENGNELGTVIIAGSATVVASGNLPSCPADLTGDGELNFFDVSAFLSAFTAMEPAGDFNNDNEYNFFDVSAFLGAFTAGCP
ncbi:MAG: hypothetical protein JKX70_11640 [Phycisphaerales bacterium]|nr:hypothetical protein [Phycisphaerales bacterium]